MLSAYLTAVRENTLGGVDEEDLADVKGEGHPTTAEETDGKQVSIFTGRVEHSPHAVNTVQNAEVEI